MKSDNLDRFFKQQIDSLERQPVPGSDWDPAKSWQRILPAQQKKVLWPWWTMGGVAATVLLMLAIFFTTLPDGNPSTETTVAQHQAMNSTEVSADEAKTAVNLGDVSEKPQTASTPVLKESSDQNTQSNVSTRKQEKIIPVKPRFEVQLAQTSGLGVKAPHARITVEKPAEVDEETAFNRVYVFRKNRQPEMATKPEKHELTVHINLTMKSNSDPPEGMFSKLK